MASRASGAGGIKQNTSVGGAGAGLAQIAGDGNTVAVLGSVSTDMPAEVQQALQAIQDALSAQPAARALTEAAVKEAKATDPNKSTIGEQLKAALDIAKATLDWTEVARKLAPSVEIAARWLGGEWGTLLKL